ncbi:sensor histidine kinase [Acrocarpospora catenulata]|uniref:sensor histidine kinase n=1 Tax=Acrocarpospora catenulata TaxID=2836182 RepID=UPI001BDB250D|nr:sensor histidine kinase [Acrocarpospora catenulata]
MRTAAAWRPNLLDLLLAPAVTAAGLVESLGRQGPQPGQIADPLPLAAGAVVAGVLVLFRRRFPASMLLALVLVGVVVGWLAPGVYYPAWHFYSTLILIHTVASAAELRSRRGIEGLVSVLVSYGYLQTLPDNDVPEILIKAIFVATAYTSGILLRRQLDRTRRLAEETTRLEVERERAVADERARIARDLHDIVAHNVSLMTLHTGAARLLLGEDPAREQERGLLLGVERAGREAVGELRLMLGVLRETDAGAAAALPGLGRLEELVEQVAASGLDVRLKIVGDRRPLPSALGLSAYRVIQEGLTNVLKHAQATGVDLVVTYGEAELTVELVDDGNGVPGDRPVAGHGLAGMRERVAQHGGELVAGPTGRGGFGVTARFPLAESG